MLRTAAATVVAALVLLPGAASPTAAESAENTTQTFTGVVTTLVREVQHDRTAQPETEQVLVTRSRIIPLPAGSDLPTGHRVTVRVRAVAGGTRRVASVERVSVKVVAGTAASTDVDLTPTVHQVYIALVSPLGHTLGENKSTAASVTATLEKANDYWASQTRDVVTFQVAQVLAPYQSAYRCGRTQAMWDEALSKFGTDADGHSNAWGVDKHLLLVAPAGTSESDTCPYGLGTVGGLHVAGNAVFVSDANQSLFAHELGHNLGLNHANALRCPHAQDHDSIHLQRAMGGGCQAVGYDDLLDVMGYSGETFGEGNLNAAHLDDMGIQADVVQTVPRGSTATVRIAPLSSTSGGTRAVKVADADGHTYFLDYRTSSGRDTAAGRNPSHPQLGVEVLREDPELDPGQATGSYLLDATPTPHYFDYNRALPVGGVFRSATQRLTFEVLSEDAEGATVLVNDTAPAKVPARVVVHAPGQVRRGALFTVTGSVTDASLESVPYWHLTLERRYVGTSRWVPVRAAITGVRGTVSKSTRTGRSAYYRLGTADRGVSASSLVRVR